MYLCFDLRRKRKYPRPSTNNETQLQVSSQLNTNTGKSKCKHQNNLILDTCVSQYLCTFAFKFMRWEKLGFVANEKLKPHTFSRLQSHFIEYTR